MPDNAIAHARERTTSFTALGQRATDSLPDGSKRMARYCLLRRFEIPVSSHFGTSMSELRVQALLIVVVAKGRNGRGQQWLCWLAVNYR